MIYFYLFSYTSYFNVKVYDWPGSRNKAVMRVITILLTLIGARQALYPLNDLERLWTKIDVAGAIERFVNGVTEYYQGLKIVEATQS